MKNSFETTVYSSREPYLLQGRLLKMERFSLCLVRTDLTERWYQEFNPVFVHSIATKVGNVKKMMTFWEMISEHENYASKGISIEVLADIPAEFTMPKEKDRIYLVLQEKTTFGVSRYPFPLEERPFTEEEYKENLALFFNEIKRLECIRLINEKEINQLKSKLLNMSDEMNKTSVHRKKSAGKFKNKIAKVQQDLCHEKLYLSSITPEAYMTEILKRAKKLTQAENTEIPADFL